ncbi:AbrB/MazE/SpoVT family DNA-binding domain-containing protein [Methanothrix soehngenii]|uniref:AbrB/MazE/SpoVT family DNA-binding domain-containing protein n=1 Tax=Methanothrix soehngenii TaxID=2223 RepID=UPI00300C5B52
MTTTTLTRRHQITLPTAIVQALELAPGSQVEWSIGADGTLIGRPMPSRAQRAAALHGAGRKYLRPGADPVQDLIAERLEDDDDYRAEP